MTPRSSRMRAPAPRAWPPRGLLHVVELEQGGRARDLPARHVDADEALHGAVGEHGFLVPLVGEAEPDLQ